MDFRESLLLSYSFIGQDKEKQTLTDRGRGTVSPLWAENSRPEWLGSKNEEQNRSSNTKDDFVEKGTIFGS